MTNQERYESLQARFRTACEKEDAYRMDVLWSKYRDRRPSRSWLTRTEVNRLEAFQRSQDRIGEQFFALLDRIGGRYWRSGAPYHWILTELSYADAITTGPLSVVPPVPYGYSQKDTERFTGAVETAA